MDKNQNLDKAKIASLYQSGMNLRQIGKALGVSNACIGKFIIEHNIYALTRTYDYELYKKRRIKKAAKMNSLEE